MNNPEVKKNEDPVTPFNYQIQHTLKLPQNITPLPARFDEVVTKRASVREFKGLTLQQVSDILWYTAKIKKISLQENGYILTHRGVPSAGARHPIDIIVINSALFGSEDLYYYNPFEHSLNQLITLNKNKEVFLKHINEIVDITDATIIWFVAHTDRTSAKYQNATSLVWRDAGALINGIQLVSTAMRINCCPIGSLGEPYISCFFENQEGVFGAGGLLIG
jgi:SagB-type dehydrogenase family enzyme